MSTINTSANLSTVQNRFDINWTVIYGPRDNLNVMSKCINLSTVNEKFSIIFISDKLKFF